MRLLTVYALLSALALPALRGQNVNLALQGQATQSSTAYSADASRAIDGSRDGFWQHNSVTMTTDMPGNWWQVAFSRDIVNEVRLYNRSDA
jgi:thiol-activated cytolysin